MDYTKVQLEIERLKLCAEVADLTYSRLKDDLPTDPDQQADIYLATDALARSVGRLLYFINKNIMPQPEDEEIDE